jgi:flagellar M-ring protein FliF
MTRLVKDAVGFDESRGDSVNVVNAAFRGEPEMKPIEIEPVPLWERPLIRDIAKLLAGLIVLIVLVLAVLRPLVRGLLGPAHAPRAPAPLPAPADAGVQQEGELIERQVGYEERIEQARALVNQDPARVAQVVKTWVGKDE